MGSRSEFCCRRPTHRNRSRRGADGAARRDRSPEIEPARPDDGRLELGLVTARNPLDWARTFSRLALGQAKRSPFVELTRGTKVKVRFGRKIPYELDGGARRACRELRIKVRPASITICVPETATAGSAAAAGGERA